MQLTRTTHSGLVHVQPAARCRRQAVAAVPAAPSTRLTGCSPALASALVASVAASQPQWQRSRCSRVAAAAQQQLEQPPLSSSDGEDDALDFAVALAEIADATKATDISVLHVAPLVSWTSYMVLLTVMSRPQLLAVLGRMEDAAGADWGRERSNTGRAASQWEVLDFGDVVVHAFTSETREFYDLDSFFAAAEEVELPFAPQPADDGDDGGDDGSSSGAAGGGGPVWAKSL